MTRVFSRARKLEGMGKNMETACTYEGLMLELGVPPLRALEGFY